MLMRTANTASNLPPSSSSTPPGNTSVPPFSHHTDFYRSNDSPPALPLVVATSCQNPFSKSHWYPFYDGRNLWGSVKLCEALPDPMRHWAIRLILQNACGSMFHWKLKVAFFWGRYAYLCTIAHRKHKLYLHLIYNSEGKRYSVLNNYNSWGWNCLLLGTVFLLLTAWHYILL